MSGLKTYMFAIKVTQCLKDGLRVDRCHQVYKPRERTKGSLTQIRPKDQSNNDHSPYQ